MILTCSLIALVGCVPHTATVKPAPIKNSEPAPTWQNAELTEEQQLAATASVRELLKDPDSATFSGLYGAKRIDGEGPLVVCGYVNAKNSYGGYVGKKRFFALPNMAGLWDDNPKYGFSSDNEMIKDVCIRR